MNLTSLTLVISLLTSSFISFAQSVQTLKKIEQVEHNLIPYVPVKGFKSWSLTERMKYYKVPGVSIAVIKDFKIDWTKTYGLADTITRKPVNQETMFSAGSISKLLTAIIAMQLVEQGKLHLDSPINKYLTSWKIQENDFTRKKQITLRMLLSHTAGTSQSAYFGFTPDKHPLPSIVEILSGAPVSESRPVVVNSEPGKEFRYSGGGFMIVQMVIMDITRHSFSDVAQSAIFEKLKMANSTFEQPLPPNFTLLASGAYSAAPWFKGMPYVYPQQAAAGLYTTATDLAKLFIELQHCYKGSGKLLTAASTRQMLTPAARISNGSYLEEMGLGAFLLERSDNRSSKGKYFEHQGANAGFISYAIGSVEDGNGVVIMMNTGDDFNGFGKELRRSVAKVYKWKHFLPDEILPVKLDDTILNSFTGRYRKAADEVIYLKKENGYLVENINDGPEIYCFPVSTDSIVFTDFNIKGGFSRDQKGNVISLQLQWEDRAMLKMNDNEFSPGEFLVLKNYPAAKAAFREMKMNEYQLTYRAYELLNKKPIDFEAVKIILDLAVEEHPAAGIVYSRWGDYYVKLHDTANAIKSYEKAIELDPNDQQTKDELASLTK